MQTYNVFIENIENGQLKINRTAESNDQRCCPSKTASDIRASKKRLSTRIYKLNEIQISALSTRFAPHEALAAQILPYVVGKGHDPAHDVSHLVRVWRMAVQIAAIEGGDLRLLAAATILHDCLPVAKTSPDRPKASGFAAVHAGDILRELGWEAADITVVTEAIRAHSFSAGLTPETPEARALHDADRLDGIGAIGIARCLMVSGAVGRPLYEMDDPGADNRDLDDVAWTLDHFHARLLRLIDTMATPTGRRAAEERHERAFRFYEEVLEELSAPIEPAETVLPDPGFRAEHVAQTSSLDPARRALAFDLIDDPHLEATPLKDVPFDTLFTYMHRRFGPPSLGNDTFKDLSAAWLLSTPDPELFVIVSPSLVGAHHSFSPYMTRSGQSPHIERRSFSPERVEALTSAYRTLLIDLLRPVRVRDSQFNALGIVGDDDPLNEWDEETEEHTYGAPYHPSCGYNVPLGVFGTEAWTGILNLAVNLGERDLGRGLESLVDLGRRQLFETIAAEPEHVRLLVAAGAVGPKHTMVLDGLGLGTEQQALAGDVAAALLGLKTGPRPDFVMPEFTDDEARRATDLLRALDIEAPMKKSLGRYRFYQQGQRIWEGLLAVVGEDFPDSAVPKRRWPNAEMITAMPAALREAGRDDIATYIEAVLTEDGGNDILQLQFGALFDHLESQKAGTGDTEEG